MTTFALKPEHLDLANHHADATLDQIRVLCAQVKQYGFNAAFVNPFYVPFAKSQGVRVGTVISFPLGQELPRIKCLSAIEATACGADELDISLNVGLIKTGDWDESLSEMVEIVKVIRLQKPQTIIKFIPETGYLTSDEIKKTAGLILQSGADFYKPCSGMGPRGATLEDVNLVREAVGDKLKIKVAGGITTYEQAMSFIQAGADRIGTSHAVEIMTEQESKGNFKR